MSAFWVWKDNKPILDYYYHLITIITFIYFYFFISIISIIIWVCLKIVYPYTQWLMIIIPTKWL
jgi:hypothetical protein